MNKTATVNRTATDAIQGYLYQFHKTVYEIMVNGDTEVLTIEGVEDIDISTPSSTKLIQCKYHESKNSFILSDIYKPIILMLEHFKENQTETIEYVLFAFFPNETLGKKSVSKLEIETILKTGDKKLGPKAAEIVKSNINIDDFLTRFTFEIGKSLTDLVADTQKLILKELENFCSDEDIKSIFYPNSIQKIATLSIQRNISNRTINKNDFITDIKNQKEAAITRWTRELLNFEQILKKRRNGLLQSLNENSRLRYFIIKHTSLSDFSDEIVNFIYDFINKYNSKIKLHDQTPIFCLDCANDIYIEIVKRIYQKGLAFHDGMIANTFDVEYFLKEPMRHESKGQIEFVMRICQLNENSIKAINKKKCNDLFFVTDCKGDHYSLIDKKDVNEQIIETSNFLQLKFVLNLSKNY